MLVFPPVPYSRRISDFSRIVVVFRSLVGDELVQVPSCLAKVIEPRLALLVSTSEQILDHIARCEVEMLSDVVHLNATFQLVMARIGFVAHYSPAA